MIIIPFEVTLLIWGFIAGITALYVGLQLLGNYIFTKIDE